MSTDANILVEQTGKAMPFFLNIIGDRAFLARCSPTRWATFIAVISHGRERIGRKFTI